MESFEKLIIVAPDKFKGTLSAAEAADIIADGIRLAFPDVMVRVCPMADGGDGTASVVGRSRGLSPSVRRARNAYGEPVDVELYESDDLAVVDSASVIGLAMLGSRHLMPFEASSFWLGEFVKRLIDEGKRKIIIGIGGTATVDGGAGFLQALGARYFDVTGTEIPAPVKVRSLADIFTIDFSCIDRRVIRERVEALADVDVPLLGSLDYAGQKGVADTQISLLREGLENFRMAVDEALFPPCEQSCFQGAGGGLGYVLGRVLRCRIVAGAQEISGIYRLFDNMQPSVVVTGEGMFDSQSMSGKVVGSIYRDASSRKIQTLVFAGRTSFVKKMPLMEVVSTEPFRGGAELTVLNARNALRDAVASSVDIIADILRE